MAILCPPHNLLFIMAPRTGCTALGRLLIAELDGEYFPQQNVIVGGRLTLDGKHTTLKQLRETGLLTEAQRQQLFVFSTVRNPFDSLVSLYVKKSSKYVPLLEDPTSWVHMIPGYVEDMQFCRTHSFDEWIEKRYAPGLLTKLRGKGRKALSGRYTADVDFVMRFESLEQDFNEVLRRAGVARSLTIPQVNPTVERNRDYRRYYSPRSRQIVEYVFRDELQRFGYEF